MKYIEVSRKVKKHGCHETSKSRGSHRQWYNPHTDSYSVLPFHGSDEIPTSVVRKFVKQLGIDWPEFNNRT